MSHSSSSFLDTFSDIKNLTISTSVSANALTIAVKTKSGNDPSSGDPVRVGMRSSTLTSGVYNQRSITGALSLVVSSGSTLGQTSAKAARLFVYLIDNDGTLELAVSQYPYQENQLISTTAEGGAGGADSGLVVYSTTARSNVPFRMIATIDNTQSTAGIWTSAGTKLQVGSYSQLANEVVSFHAEGTAGGSIGTSLTLVTFNSTILNTNTCYDTSTGVFTALVSGIYDFAWSVQTGAITLATNERVLTVLYKDGVAFKNGDRPVGNAGSNNYVSTGSITGVQLLAGQTISIYAVSSVSTTASTSVSASYFTGSRRSM